MPLVDTPDCLARLALFISTSKMSISMTFIFLQTVWTCTACAQVFDFRSSLSIRDFFGPFLFFAPFFASRTLGTTLFLRVDAPTILSQWGTASTDTFCIARDAKHHTLGHHCKIPSFYLSRTTSPLSFWVLLSFS